MNLICVLLWKDLMIAKRRIIASLFLLGYPIAIVVLFTYANALTALASKKNMTNLMDKKYKEDPFMEDQYRFLSRCLLYTPNSRLAEILMKQVGKRLLLTRLTAMPDISTCNGYFPFSNYTEITKLIDEITKGDAVIIFEDMEANSWSERKQDRLTYTIRMKGDFNTRPVTDDVENENHQIKITGGNYNDFVRIQWAIDTSYIQVRANKTVPQELSLQEFPIYRSFKERMDVTSMSAAFGIFASVMGNMYLFIHIMNTMIRERSDGVQQLIKMSGVSETTLGLAFFLSYMPAAAAFSVSASIVFTTPVFNNITMIEYTSAVIIFIGLWLYVVSIIAFTMALSYVTHKTKLAILLGILGYIGSVLPFCKLVTVTTLTRPVEFLTGLLWHVPLKWIFFNLAYFEAKEQSTDILTTEVARASVLEAYICFTLQSVIYFTLAWYLSHVRQGKHGNSLPWNFLWVKESKRYSHVTDDDTTDEAQDPKFFEDPPRKEVGIRIENVSKIYPEKQALKNVSLDVYQGEITILLGHNGAGKTTLMSIITGMTCTTRGQVLVNGIETFSNRLRVRKDIGLCTQENLFIEKLNAQEHVMFFKMIKDGSSLGSARRASLELLTRLGIGDKADASPMELSGGMKRRLQLVCALAGGSKVLVLDEPTSGLDVETRRELWNLLLSLRGGHTVLLSTHFMEEADALGDRVAALHNGHLRCHATPMHLKRAMGSGYRVTITSSGGFHEAEITQVVTKQVAEATIIKKAFNSITYNLPIAATPQFPALFKALEEQRESLGISTIGVGASTLEEVFLQICSDSEYLDGEETGTVVTGSVYGKLKGKQLYQRQAIALFKRHIKYNFHKSNIISFLVWNIAIPAILVYWSYISDGQHGQDKNKSGPKILMDLNIYKSLLPERRALVNVNATGASLKAKEKYNHVKLFSSKNITIDLLKIGEKNIEEYNKFLVGVELDDNHAKAYYTTGFRHAAPVAVNLLSNVIASQYLPAAGPRAITLHNHPLQLVQQEPQGSPVITANSAFACLLWLLITCLVIMFVNAKYGALPANERVTGMRHVHVMAGCPAALHWLCTLAAHTAVAALIMLPVLMLASALSDTNHRLIRPALFLILFLIFILGSIAFFSFTYLLHVCFEEKTALGITTACTLLFGLVTPIMNSAVYKYYMDPEDMKTLAKEHSIYVDVALMLSVLFPQHITLVLSYDMVNVARLNALCELNIKLCPNLEVADPMFDKDKCCAGEADFSYFTFDSGLHIMTLITHTIVYMTFVILVQIGVVSCLFDRIYNASFKPQALTHVDELVAREAIHVEKEINLPTQQIEKDNEALLVSNLHKNFFGFFKGTHAVKGISFCVKKGECFGLLGTNGAGKSTTFRMLTADLCPTTGRVYGNGHFLNEEKKQYLRKLCYCPQHSGIDDFQTGSDNLRTLLVIRGLDDADIDRELDAWITVIGLQKYRNMRAMQYSGGYKRRLAAAVALCSGAPLSLLDEPTAGVDVGARRLVHAALKRSINQGRSIVITSHSMDEMEALCGRIAIMTGGVIRALGTPAELHARHAQGHAVLFKITQRDGRDESELDNLKASMNSQFTCRLKDEHATMLHYHIENVLSYSELFSRLEKLREGSRGLVEDYAITETTLEEIFLHFARERQEALQLELEAELANAK